MLIYEAKLAYNLISPGEITKIEDSAKAVEYMQTAFSPESSDPTKETVWILMLDRKFHPIGRHLVSVGSINASLVSPPAVLKPLILASATSFILFHNHPSGDPTPSTADIKVTKKLKSASEYLEIELTDHIIIGHPNKDPHGIGFYSFAESGII